MAKVSTVLAIVILGGWAIGMLILVANQLITNTKGFLLFLLSIVVAALIFRLLPGSGFPRG